MSGTTGTIPLNTVVADQLITSAERNAELANIGALMDAAGCGGHSDTDSDTQIQTNPYPGSVLSKATSIAGELERLRYQLAQILGTDYWYKPAATDLTSVGNVVVPLGGTIEYPVATPPSSQWHLADGTAISRAIYASLFTLIGTTFGIGDGTTTFNLPDYRDRMSIGAGNLYAAAITGGEATHTLTTAELPHQTHTVTDPGHNHTDAGHSHGVTDPSHTHLVDTGSSAGTGTLVGPGSVGAATRTTHPSATGVTVNSGNASINSNTTGISVADTNGGGAHNNLPPYLAIYKLIRVL